MVGVFPFKFEDINYAVASREDKEAMFLEYSELLNSLDSGATTKITINNRRLNKADFEQTILIPMADDGLDKYRKEYNKMLLDKATGANSIVQDKYVTVSVCKKNIEEARNYFARVGADLIAHFNRLGSKCVELDAGDKLPFDLDGAAIYYAGPTQAKDGMAIGSCGPTTSSRMDVYSPMLLDMGLSAMIGKGERSEAVCEAIRRNGAVYFCAIGGAGALACKCIPECEVIAFEDLGCESVKRLRFEKFPLIVTIDCVGGNLFKSGREKYCRK